MKKDNELEELRRRLEELENIKNSVQNNSEENTDIKVDTQDEICEESDAYGEEEK